MDLAIIGAGPIGLFAAFQAGLLGMKVCVIDTLEQVGGKCSSLYPEKPIYDIPAHPSILAGDFIKNLEKQAKNFKPVFYLDEQVVELVRKDEAAAFILKTSTGKKINTKTVLIAAGSGSFMPNKPRIEGLDKHEGKSVLYSVKNKNDFKGKKVVIFGGGDAAIDWTLELVNHADSVTLVHRRDEFRCASASLEAVEDLKKAGKLSIHVSQQLIGLKDEGDILRSLIIEDKDQIKKELIADAALFFFGVSIVPGPILEWGLDIEQRLIKVDVSKMCTNLSGIYAAGDIVSYPGKIKSIVTGFGEVVTACHAIQKYLNPDKPQSFIHSTSRGELFNGSSK
jgi:thioredoxin reductase (NADPH)